MAKIRIKSIKVKNYRSFWPTEQEFVFPDENFKRPVAIIGYNNCGKTNLMNVLKYWLYESVREETFELKDFHQISRKNPPFIELEFVWVGLDDEKIHDNISYKNTVKINVTNKTIISVDDYCNASFYQGKYFSKKWSIKQGAPIYYINFHNIKEEISTQKTSWGNLKSFLGKHIKKIVDEDSIMKARQEDFQEEIKNASKDVLLWKENETDQNKRWKSKLSLFIEKIKEYYNQNLRDNAIDIDFSLPEYEDIFLQMIFKIGLNGNSEKMVPIDHFWDGYISMFVMAVIQAIAEENIEDKALFLFEEPESFLHENHQEYFYKAVLCKLAEKWHQVIYTTHSARMVDMFDTKGIIRLEMDKNNQTIKKYNKSEEDCAFGNIYDSEEQEVPLADYNTFIKTIEPNLNKILFSKKVILVEWPNDLLVYKYVIKKKVEEYIQNKPAVLNKEEYAETYLNYENIVIIPHHWKSTAIYLIKLCQHFWIDYFVINDWDLEEVTYEQISDNSINSLEGLHSQVFYTSLDTTSSEVSEEVKKKNKSIKSQITNNFNLLKAAGEENIHFNIPKLEVLIGYNSNDKDPIKIYKTISSDFQVSRDLFPESLASFLGLNGTSVVNGESAPQENDDLPF